MGKTKKQAPKERLLRGTRPKTVLKANNHDSFQKTVQKQRKKFRHFVFTETAPAMNPNTFVNEALRAKNDLLDKNVSYVLFAHSPLVVGNEECNSCCVRGLKQCQHYHLFTCSDRAGADAKNLRAATDNVYIESSYFQHVVVCPLTEYATLKMCETMQLIAHVGEAFRGLDKLLNIQRYTSLEILKKLSHWSNSTPIWELQKQSQTLALEHWIGVVNSGPFKHTLQNVIAAMVMRQGFVNYEQHGWKLNFECGLSDYQCVCEHCVSTNRDSYVYSNYGEAVSDIQTYKQPITPITYSTMQPQTIDTDTTQHQEKQQPLRVPGDPNEQSSDMSFLYDEETNDCPYPLENSLYSPFL